MKTLAKISVSLICMFVVVLGNTHTCYAQDSKKSKEAEKAEAIKAMVESKTYVFNVESVRPMKGGTRHLSPGNTLRVTADTVVADLPYFGQAYQASLSSDGGLKFTSTQFDYTAAVRKKGGWDITIKPKDVHTAQNMLLTIFDNGTAHLDVNSSDRQPITYNGYIADKKQ